MAGQDDAEVPAGGAGHHGNAPAMRLGEFARDGEAEPGALDPAARLGAPAEEGAAARVSKGSESLNARRFNDSDPLPRLRVQPQPRRPVPTELEEIVDFLQLEATLFGLVLQ